MSFDILRFIETTHPLKFIMAGFFMISVGLNFAQHASNIKLSELLKRSNRPHIIIIVPDADNIINSPETTIDDYTRQKRVL